MPKNYLTYEFNTATVKYPATYDSTKLNMGWLMTSSIDTEGKQYVSPVEPGFLRGFEIIVPSPIVSSYNRFNTIGTLKYDENTIWCFTTNGEYYTTGAVPRRIFFFKYNKLTGKIEDNQYKSINISFDPNQYHQCYSIDPTLDTHTTGSIQASGSLITGSGTTWKTDGACVGNRIGFGSTSSAAITTWYQISSITNNTTLNIVQGVNTDGNPSQLNLTGSVPYVIEDFRLMYVTYGNAVAASRGIVLVKGLRPEIFAISPITVPAATTVDNLRAGYRLVDGPTTSATYSPIAAVIEPKVSLTEQYLFTVSKPPAASTTTISIQKFNVRANLSGSLVSGRSSGSFVFTTGAQAHGGTNTSETDVMARDNSGNYYVSHYTRMSRIPTGSIVSGSTTFISSSMLENPTGGTGSFALSSQLADICYMPQIDRFYITHLQGTVRNYISRFRSGSQFEAQVHANDQIQQSTYLVNEFETLTPNFLGSKISAYYNDGIMFFCRDVATNNNIIYALPLEADAQFESTSSACIITPELLTTSASAYTGIYVDSTDYFNTNRFSLTRQPYYLYYRTSGITNNSGSWTYLPPSGSMPAATSSIQFKLTFSTLGYYSMPARVHGITLTYSSSLPQQSITNYDPSVDQTDTTSQIFAWRQSSLFNGQSIPDLGITIYSGSTVILSDTVSTSVSGSWEYSTNNGGSWLTFNSAANAVGNYIRYTASPTLPSGSILNTLLYI